MSLTREEATVRRKPAALCPLALQLTVGDAAAAQLQSGPHTQSGPQAQAASFTAVGALQAQGSQTQGSQAQFISIVVAPDFGC